MVIYLASILEPDNFGPGRLIGIYDGKKPNHIEIKFKFNHFIPNKEIIIEYYKKVILNKDCAATIFEAKFRKQLSDFAQKVLDISGQKNKPIPELLNLNEGDTLLSWERKNNSNYRHIVAETLKSLNFDVVSN